MAFTQDITRSEVHSTWSHSVAAVKVTDLERRLASRITGYLRNGEEEQSAAPRTEEGNTTVWIVESSQRNGTMNEARAFSRRPWCGHHVRTTVR